MTEERRATTPRAVGLSMDGRATVWSVECPMCKRVFEPYTTLFKYQRIECPKCASEMIADYDTTPPKVTISEPTP